MEDRFIEDSVKERLILAGLGELMEHGSADFSLRRVAIAAQVSCAAPYRHFKDKDELIRAVISHIREDWILLAGEISTAFSEGGAEHVTELAVSYVRFWIAGGNFASFLNAGMLSGFDDPIVKAVRSYAQKSAISPDRASSLTNLILSLAYGAVTLVTSGVLSADTAVAELRLEIVRALGNYT